MISVEAIWTPIQETAIDVLSGTIGYLPSLLAALLVLAIGWLLSRLARAASRRILVGVNRLLERTFRRGLLASARLPAGISTVLGEVAFWAVNIVALTIAARVARLPAISSWLNEIVGFLPNILFGVATITVGYLFSVVVGEQVTAAAKAAKATHSALLGQISQGVVFVMAAIIGLDQVGVDVSFLVALSGVAVGAILLGFSVAFGLGSRDYVSNLIGARTVRQSLHPGLLVRIGSTQGEVLEVTQTHIALDADDGRVLVPARMAEVSEVVIVPHQEQTQSGETP